MFTLSRAIDECAGGMYPPVIYQTGPVRASIMPFSVVGSNMRRTLWPSAIECLLLYILHSLGVSGQKWNINVQRDVTKNGGQLDETSIIIET